MPNYAIVETGSKQYWVEPKTVFEVELLSQTKDQKEIILDKVLLSCEGEKVKIGTPTIQGAKVICENLGNIRGPKVIHFRYRRRKASRRKRGHRQELNRLMVKEIKA